MIMLHILSSRITLSFLNIYVIISLIFILGACMQRYLRILDSFYLLLLGVGVGGIVACGTFAAPVIFHIGDFIEGITQSESGLIMGRIFVRLNTYLLFLVVIMAAYEGLGVVCYLTKKEVRYMRAWAVLGVCNIALILLFAYYYTPFILDPQNLASEHFQSMHEQSVWVFKLLMLGLSILFIWRGYALHYHTNTQKDAMKS